MRNQAPPPPLVIAHRGASGLAPENTTLAVAAAIALGADMVEVDVRPTRDGRLVIFHDRATGRTARFQPRTYGKGRRGAKIADLTIEQLKRLDAGSWKGPAFAGLAVPTLSEILAQCAGRIALNLELKVDRTLTPTERERFVAGLGQTLRMQWPTGPAKSLLLSSIDHETLRLVRRALPFARIGVLITAGTGAKPGGLLAARRLAKRLEAYSLHLPMALASPALVKSLHREGLRVFVYTVNRADLMRRWLTVGVDGMFTDRPERLLALLAAGKPQAPVGRRLPRP